jgi:alpha-D-ribose 1-methylphosphonate 5-triphosphate synthase subunit PhnL
VLFELYACVAKVHTGLGRIPLISTLYETYRREAPSIAVQHEDKLEKMNTTASNIERAT